MRSCARAMVPLLRAVGRLLGTHFQDRGGGCHIDACGVERVLGRAQRLRSSRLRPLGRAPTCRCCDRVASLPHSRHANVPDVPPPGLSTHGEREQAHRDDATADEREDRMGTRDRDRACDDARHGQRPAWALGLRHDEDWALLSRNAGFEGGDSAMPWSFAGASFPPAERATRSRSVATLSTVVLSPPSSNAGTMR